MLISFIKKYKLEKFSWSFRRALDKYGPISLRPIHPLYTHIPQIPQIKFCNTYDKDFFL